MAGQNDKVFSVQNLHVRGERVSPPGVSRKETGEKGESESRHPRT